MYQKRGSDPRAMPPRRSSAFSTGSTRSSAPAKSSKFPLFDQYFINDKSFDDLATVLSPFRTGCKVEAGSPEHRSALKVEFLLRINYCFVGRLLFKTSSLDLGKITMIRSDAKAHAALKTEMKQLYWFHQRIEDITFNMQPKSKLMSRLAICYLLVARETDTETRRLINMALKFAFEKTNTHLRSANEVVRDLKSYVREIVSETEHINDLLAKVISTINSKTRLQDDVKKQLQEKVKTLLELVLKVEFAEDLSELQGIMKSLQQVQRFLSRRIMTLTLPSTGEKTTVSSNKKPDSSLAITKTTEETLAANPKSQKKTAASPLKTATGSGAAKTLPKNPDMTKSQFLPPPPRKTNPTKPVPASSKAGKTSRKENMSKSQFLERAPQNTNPFDSDAEELKTTSKEDRRMMKESQFLPPAPAKQSVASKARIPLGREDMSKSQFLTPVRNKQGEDAEAMSKSQIFDEAPEKRNAFDSNSEDDEDAELWDHHMSKAQYLMPALRDRDEDDGFDMLDDVNEVSEEELNDFDLLEDLDDEPDEDIEFENITK